MINYLTAEKEIEKDIKENNLNVVEGWSVEELDRIFALKTDEELIGHAKRNRHEEVGPNYFMVGGPYPNYSTVI